MTNAHLENAKERIRDEHRQSLNKIARRYVAVAALGVSTFFGLDFYAKNKLSENPYAEVTEVYGCLNARRTLSQLESDLNIINKSEDRLGAFYVPQSGADKEIEVLFGNRDTEKLDALKSYIAKVKTDLREMQLIPAVRNYDNWNEKYSNMVFNVEQIGIPTIAASVMLFAYATHRAGKRRDKAIKDLEAQTA